MKITSTASPSRMSGTGQERVARALHEGGPATASVLARRLDLTTTVVRRHLDSLEEAGYVEAGERAPFGPRPVRGRGRPARVYSLTGSGRAVFDQAYDDLAVNALRFLSESYGDDAVMDFAERRARDIERRYSAVIGEGDTVDRIEALAAALRADGYAASAVPSQSPGGGEQVCQHHCPIAVAAAEFPQLCEAETQAFGRLLGTHVMRLATIAHGDGVCTTHVPLPTAGRSTA